MAGKKAASETKQPKVEKKKVEKKVEEETVKESLAEVKPKEEVLQEAEKTVPDQKPVEAVAAGGAVEADAGKKTEKKSPAKVKKETAKKKSAEAAEKAEPATESEEKAADVKESAEKTSAAKKEPEEKTAAEKKAPAEKEAAAKEPAKKAAEKKETASGTAGKKAAAEKEPKFHVTVEHYGRQISEKDIIANVKKAWTGSGKKLKDMKSVELYIKPEENAVYFVVNGKETGVAALYE